MNNEEKNVMTILTISRIVESSLWYCLKSVNPEGFSTEERKSRFEALTALTEEGSPFATNCDNNGDLGKELKEDMHYFIEDVYGNSGRIVYTTLNGDLVVEQSLTLELFHTIVNLRARLEAFLHAAMKALKERDLLSAQVEKLIMTDIRYYHCLAGKISCILISNNFQDINKAANTYAQAYSKEHNGINPNTDSEFDVRNDPSFRMLENEFHQLNQDMLVILNSYGEGDSEFERIKASIYSDCEIFNGKKTTTDLKAFFKMFVSYFDPLLSSIQNELNQMFIDVGQQMQNETEPVKA